MAPMIVPLWFLLLLATPLVLASVDIVRRIMRDRKVTLEAGDHVVLGDISFTVRYVDHPTRTVILENDAPEGDQKKILDEMSIDDVIRLSQEDD